MALNPFSFSQAQNTARMPQVGFGQSNPSPQYGGMPNQNAFTNANPAANLYSRFGDPSTGGGLPLPGSPPNFPQADGVSPVSDPNRMSTIQPYYGSVSPVSDPNRMSTIQPYYGSVSPVSDPNRMSTIQPYYGGISPYYGGMQRNPIGDPSKQRLSPYSMALMQRFGMGGGPNPMAFQNANPSAGLYDRFGGGGMYSAQPAQPTLNYLAYPR